MRRLLPLVLLAAAALAAACGGGASTPSATRTTTPVEISPGDGAQQRATPFGGTPPPFPFSTPDPRTPDPAVPIGYYVPDGNGAPPLVPEGAAVYLTLGDSIQYGCCADIQLSSHPRLAAYLSQKLNRQVVWVSLAGNGTLQTFIHGINGETPQLDNAVSLLSRLRDEGHDVVLISLSIGGNDLLALRDQGCQGGGQPECVDAFSDLMNIYTNDMQGVYAQLNAAKDPATPVFQNTIYDPLDCGQPGSEITTSAVAVKVLNSRMEGAAKVGGAFLVDFYEPFKGHACELISGVDPTYFGYDLILDLDKAAYDALPTEYVDPWRR